MDRFAAGTGNRRAALVVNLLGQFGLFKFSECNHGAFYSRRQP